MSTRRTVLFGVIGLVGLLALAAAILHLLVDTNAFKSRLELTASRALGMEVGIAGSLAIHLFPGLRATAEDVHLRRGGVEVVSAKQATIDVDFSSVLGNVRIERIVLLSPTITIDRGRDGRFNFERGQTGGEPLPALDWPDVSFSDGAVVYTDSRFDTSFEAHDCRADLHGLRHSGGQRPNRLRELSFTAEVACKEVRKGEFTVLDLRLTADAKDGIFALKPVTTQVFGTPGSGSVRADFSGAAPAYEFTFSLAQFPVEELLKTASMKPVASGRMDLSTHLSTRGKAVREWQQAMAGSISLRGKGLVFSGGDLDGAFARYESSQTFDLFDVGGVLLAGPLGLLVTKGHDFAALSKGMQGNSDIRTLVSDWKVEHGVAQAQDVAMATNKNRVALHGSLDFVNDRFEDVTIALIDANGCAMLRQQIHGSFREPVVEKPNLLQSLAGPALRLLKKGGDLLGGRHCDAFYTGSVMAAK